MVLIKQGCYEFDSYKGWQTVTPCPAHVICGKLTIEKSQSGGTHCPTDFHYKFPDTIGHEKTAEGENPLLPFAIESYVQKRTISEWRGASMVAVGVLIVLCILYWNNKFSPVSVRFESGDKTLQPLHHHATLATLKWGMATIRGQVHRPQTHWFSKRNPRLFFFPLSRYSTSNSEVDKNPSIQI